MEIDYSQPTPPPMAENNAKHLILQQQRRDLVSSAERLFLLNSISYLHFQNDM